MRARCHHTSQRGTFSRIDSAHRRQRALLPERRGCSHPKLSGRTYAANGRAERGQACLSGART